MPAVARVGARVPDGQAHAVVPLDVAERDGRRPGPAGVELSIFFFFFSFFVKKETTENTFSSRRFSSRRFSSRRSLLFSLSLSPLCLLCLLCLTLKNRDTTCDAGLVGYSLQTYATRMAQLTPPRYPATLE